MTMKSVDLPHLRSVVLAGHAGSGKTTLAEQLLFRAGAIPRLGRVDDGTAHLDFEPEEQKRRESLSLAVGDVRGGRDADLAGRHARLPGLHRRRHRGLRRGRRRDLRDGRVGRRRGRARARRRPRRARPAPPPASSSTRATARTPTRPRPSTRCARPSATRSRRSSSRSAPPSRSSGYVDLVHRKAWQLEDGTARSRSRSRTTWPPRSPAAATSCSRRPPRPTTTS